MDEPPGCETTDWVDTAPGALDAFCVREPDEVYRPAAKPRLLDQVRGAIRARHYSYRTEEAYVGWIRRFILFHRKRHPTEMGPGEISDFLTALAVERKVSASTQNQALAALLFLYHRSSSRILAGWTISSAPAGPNACWSS